MQTRLAALAAQVAESGWLAALVVVPLFFNTQTVRVFEEEKVLLLRSLALVIAAGLCVWTVEVGHDVWRVGDRPLWRLPLVRPALALTAVYVAATVFSVAPRVSWWGAYIRTQGTYTWLSYIVVFVALLALVRRRQQLDRVITVILLASVPAAVYGVLQHYGFDPIAWAAPTDRVHSTAGNPIFLGGYLIMVVPLTLARIIQQVTALRTPSSGSTSTTAGLLLAAYAGLLVLQLLSVMYSQSRGPFIGLAVGLTYFFIVYALHRHLRWLTITTTVLLSAGTLFLVMFNLPHSPLERLRTVPYIGRLGELAEIQSGTGKIRLLIWEGATALLARQPLRLAFGYGPETLFLVYARVYPPELAHYENRGAAPDRSHNETFDALITIGVAGFVAQLIVFLAFFRHTLQWLGMINSRAQQRAFWSAAVAGGAAGVTVPWLLDGGVRFAGVGFPAGIATGCLVYLIGFALTHLRARRPAPQADDLLLIAVLAAVMGHFVEIHFGIAITATRLLFWLYAGLAVIIGVRLAGDASEGGQPPTDRQEPLLSGALVTASPIVGLILVTLTFDFYTTDVDLQANAFACATLAASVWIIGALLIAAEPGVASERLTRLIAYAATSLGVWLLFIAIYGPVSGGTPVLSGLSPELVRTVASYRGRGISIFYGFLLLILCITAVTSAAREGSRGQALVRSMWRAALYPLVLAAIAAVVVTTNLRSSWADVLAKDGGTYERQGQWLTAAVVYEQALQLRPQEDRYVTNLSRAYVEHARRDLSNQPIRRGETMRLATTALERASERNPLETDYPHNLAKAYRTWATFGEADAARHFAQANNSYERALALSPNNATLWVEWASLYLEQQHPDRALEILDHAMEIDPQFTTTYWVRAHAQQAKGDWSAAVADYDRALAINPNLLLAWSAKAIMLARLHRIDDAIAATQQALVVAPNDVISRRNLARLYRENGQLDLALQEARAALLLAQGGDRAELESLIAELETAPAAPH